MDNKEFSYKGVVLNGFLALLLALGLFALAIFFFVKAGTEDGWAAAGVVTMMAFALCMNGFIKQEPNEAKVLVFCGQYS